jgi:hypothetical protein
MTAASAALSVVAMKRTTLALTLALTAAAGLTACGGTSRLSATDYKTKLEALSRQDTKVHANVDNLPKSKSVSQMKAGLAAFAAGERKLGAQVAALKPPKNAQQANAALAKGFNDTAGEMGQVLTAVGPAKTPQQALSIIGRLGPKMHAGKELDAALAQLQRLGYAKAG